ncbi:TIGR04282 family arsenosugar biosynthesis glycosyltransferase [Sedimentitalea sp. JM2-8]|uniref:TIGR04282 family arsenosugar biosynthesis glycosyltransferase n=1 Tax=Sedimentitalea xiamensis TaxID=3050037 RepID=A0ABT7F946_9RHOB|nr:TIGR04282 family arsenosugar biosynthesis glycosyltransferase [Sedimentitalea xiamensis]MDK3071632.1 TIGR04282 family arsenosugar biosynthesis glycosyltransferase [Sedimentitalea xiamensis]
MRRTVIVMLKEPRPGRVKTRLARGIGPVAAAWWFRHQSLALLRRIRDPRWRVVLAVSPDRDGLVSRIWPSCFARIPQGRGDLGQRMARAIRGVGVGPVCLIGTDIPGVGKPELARAFAALGRHQAVFGPARDGGFWLVGLKHPRHMPARLFHNVRWSCEHALADSRATVPDLSVALVDELQDVDTAADLERIRDLSLLTMTRQHRHVRAKP